MSTPHPTDNSIPDSCSEKLIRAHDGTVALLYLWERLNPVRNLEKAAEDLCLTVADIRAGFEKLDRMGLARSSAAETVSVPSAELHLPGPDSLPEYTPEDIQQSMEDSCFQAVVEETKAILGRGLNSTELKKLFAIYDHLGLPADVVLELVNYCSESTREKYGPSKRTTFHVIEKEAYYWANNNINTFEAAEKYIRSQKLIHDSASEIKTLLGISGREFSDTEKKYVRSWIELGFSTECIAEAYDRTVTKTGSLKWAYMDKILQNWKEKGLETMADIREKDVKHSKVSGQQSSSGSAKIDYTAAQNLLKNDVK